MNRNHRPNPKVLAHLQGRFLGIMGKIETHAQYSFRYIRCYHTRQDAIAETVALCWRWFLRLTEQGKDPTQFPSVLAGYATRQVKSGRRLCGQEPAKDALSHFAQQRHNFVTTKLPEIVPMTGNPFTEALQENTQSPIPEQVHFRLDFPRWRRTLARRTRHIADAMILGHRTLDLARRFNISPARISQMRRQLHESWRQFIDEPSLVHQGQPQEAA